MKQHVDIDEDWIPNILHSAWHMTRFWLISIQNINILHAVVYKTIMIFITF